MIHSSNSTQQSDLPDLISSSASDQARIQLNSLMIVIRLKIIRVRTMKLLKGSLNCLSTSKMACFGSEPKHGPTTHKWEYGSGSTRNQLAIASWNVNGIRSIIRKQRLQEYFTKFDPHILCVNETRIDLASYDKEYNTVFKQITQQYSYNQYWNFCKVSSGYSGVATFSKFKPIRALEDFECGYLSLEGRCLTLEFQTFFVVNCYKPNSGSSLQRLKIRTEEYDRKFLEFTSKLAETKVVIICGDLNVAHQPMDLTNPVNNRKNPGFTDQQREEFNKLLTCGFTDSFRFLHPNKVQYTWWSHRSSARLKNVGWRIDYILSSRKDIIKEAAILDQIQGSDHCPVHCQIDIS